MNYKLIWVDDEIELLKAHILFLEKKGYEVELAIDFESIGAEITQENRFGVCFARLSMPRALDERREFASWKGDHPQSTSPIGSIFISME